jgi:hypothetical protein
MVSGCQLKLTTPPYTTDISTTKPNINYGKIGFLPFSKLVSDNVITTIGPYYNGFENELVNVLRKKRVLVTTIQYPGGQKPFTYEEMEAPPFEIDPDDFATPEQILSGMSSTQGFDRIIFGHLEEVSNFLYLVVRVYSKANNKIKPALVQKIDLASLTTTELKAKIKKLAIDIMKLIQTTHPNDEGLFGLDK